MKGLWSLPTGWHWAEFSDVARVDSNLVDPAGYAQSPHIAPNHIESGSGRLLEYTTIEKDAVTSGKHLFRAGHILYSKIRPYLAKVVVVDFDGLCSADMYPVSTDLETRFLHRWLVSPMFTEQAAQNQGRTVLPKINQDGLARLPVPVAPLNEQRRIVAKLESLQARSRRAREALDAVPPLLEKLRQSILAAAFRGDLTKDWRAKPTRLADVAAFVDYRGRTPTKTASGIPLITAKNVRRGYLSATPKEYIADEEYASWMTRGVPKVGDVLITTEAPMGNVVCIDWTYRFALAQRVICLCPDDRLVFGPFLALMMQSPSFQSQLVERSTGTTVAGIKASRLKELEVPLPAVGVQRRVAAIVSAALDRVRRLELALEGELARAGSLDRALLAKAFRGELVPQDPTDEPAADMLARLRAAEAGTPARPTKARR